MYKQINTLCEYISTKPSISGQLLLHYKRDAALYVWSQTTKPPKLPNLNIHIIVNAFVKHAFQARFCNTDPNCNKGAANGKRSNMRNGTVISSFLPYDVNNCGYAHPEFFFRSLRTLKLALRGLFGL